MIRTFLLTLALYCVAALFLAELARAADERVQLAQASDANRFNRLMRAPAKRNLPPAEDGIHDPASPGTRELQAPLEAFGTLPKANSGNRVDWTSALQTKKITPRWDVKNPKAVPEAFSLDIVREVKGSTPDVVFSHAKHGQWLECANCHPAVFSMTKGANPMSMATLMLGENCGVCHGRVAFGAAECRLCHNKPKAAPATAVRTGAKR